MCAKSPISLSVLLESRVCVCALGSVVPRAYLCIPATLATQGSAQLSAIPSNCKGV